MINDHLYDLMEQLVKESQSLSRIKEFYKNDADERQCDECREFWEKMERDKEEYVNQLKGLIQRHIE